MMVLVQMRRGVPEHNYREITERQVGLVVPSSSIRVDGLPIAWQIGHAELGHKVGERDFKQTITVNGNPTGGRQNLS
jgi:hypothetical protein